MSWVYCAPKSRIRMRWAWISAWGAVEEAGRATLAIGSGYPVVGRLFGDAYVVDVALTDAGVGDSDKHRFRAHVGDVLAARVAHRGAQAACKLVQDGDYASL